MIILILLHTVLMEIDRSLDIGSVVYQYISGL